MTQVRLQFFENNFENNCVKNNNPHNQRQKCMQLGADSIISGIISLCRYSRGFSDLKRRWWPKAAIFSVLPVSNYGQYYYRVNSKSYNIIYFLIGFPLAQTDDLEAS